MSTISLRLPDSLHRAARELAARDHISINQLVAVALAEKISALKTEAYLEQRAQSGDRQRFLQALDKVEATQVPPGDEWP